MEIDTSCVEKNCNYAYAFKETHKYINTEEEEEVRKVSQVKMKMFSK